MLPEGAFLRRLPVILDRAQVVQIEALVFSVDAIDHCYKTIEQIALSFREKICDAPRGARQRMFLDSWTIVDCGHVVRQALKALDYQTPKAVEFIRKYESASILRNKMDHLTGNAWNISRSKEQSPPFGAITYLCISESDLVREEGSVRIAGIGSVMLTAGRFESPQGARMINPAGMSVEFPVSRFTLEAFNNLLDMEQLTKDLRGLIVEINDRIESHVNELADDISKDKGIAKEKLMTFGGAGFCSYIRFNAAGKDEK